MYNHTYFARQVLPINATQAWEFFSSAKNLASITPQEMKFKILTALDDREIYEGMHIDYTVKPLFGIPLHWRTEICQVLKPHLFMDRQVKGPFKIWEHTHRFLEHAHGLVMEDEVRYQLPGGVLGNLIHLMIVKKKIDFIFDFRRSVLSTVFPLPTPTFTTSII